MAPDDRQLPPETRVPVTVLRQAQSMADATAQTHYVFQERGSWLISPDLTDGLNGPTRAVIDPCPSKNAMRVWK